MLEFKLSLGSVSLNSLLSSNYLTEHHMKVGYLWLKKKTDNPECKITMFRKGLIGLLCIENEVFVQRISLEQQYLTNVVVFANRTRAFLKFMTALKLSI